MIETFPAKEASETQFRSLTEQMAWLHRQIRRYHPFVSRIAVALYDGRHDLLKTYVSSNDQTQPLMRYEVALAQVPSLQELARAREARVIHDLCQSNANASSEHTRWLLNSGFRSSYTLPLFQSGQLLGFLFFDSMQPGAFDGEVPGDLEIYVQLCRLSVLSLVNLANTVQGLVRVAKDFAHLRDIETGCHIDRMSTYCRLIAREVAPHYARDDEFVEHVYLFSPLHDIGKVGIADDILLKRGSLSDEEREIMQGHVGLGRRLVEQVIKDTGLEGMPYLRILLNIVDFHHEYLDGSGYPHGLSGDDVPLEARIATVADIFDALTSERPYKRPWVNLDALQELRRMAGAGQLDGRCVEALGKRMEQICAIQQRFGLGA